MQEPPDEELEDLLDDLPPLDGAAEDASAPLSRGDAERWLDMVGLDLEGPEVIGLDTATGPGSEEPLFELSVGDKERLSLENEAAGESITLEAPRESQAEYGWTDGNEAPSDWEGDWEDDLGDEVLAELGLAEPGGRAPQPSIRDDGEVGLELDGLTLLELGGEGDEDEVSHLPPLDLDEEDDPDPDLGLEEGVTLRGWEQEDE